MARQDLGPIYILAEEEEQAMLIDLSLKLPAAQVELTDAVLGSAQRMAECMPTGLLKGV